MRAHIQYLDGAPATVATWEAWKSLSERGWEINTFVGWRDLVSEPDEPVIGGVGTVKGALGNLGIEAPAIDYPTGLRPFLLDPDYTTQTLGWVREHQDQWPLFVKPASGFKEFTGLVIRSTMDLLTVTHVDDEAEMFVARPVDLVGSEWRAFIIDGEVRDIRPYRHCPDTVAPSAVGTQMFADAWSTCPAGYGLDVGNVGTTSAPEWRIIEVNDGYSLGTYGASRDMYTELLVKRWGELTGVRDLW